MRTGATTTPDDPPFAAAPAGVAFRDRRDAGRRLAPLLERFRAEQPLVVGMPRGGVPVAAEVARALDAPLDVVVVRKIGAPRNPEFALGAVAEGGVRVVSYDTAAALGLSARDLEPLIAEVENELAWRTGLYRDARPPLSMAGRTVIVVDDGLATGRSAQAAMASVRRRGARRVILAVPVAAPASVDALSEEADEIVCVEMPPDLWAVGAWYEDFGPTSDEEVITLLAGAEEKELSINLESGVTLGGTLTMPSHAAGLVVFAHGSGSSRWSPRNRAVAQGIVQAGYATLLFDLLTAHEELDRANVFDIRLLAGRLLSASAWADADSGLAGLPLAYFGASTGAAAALTAAARLGDRVSAVISRGGRPDLAMDLAAVRAPTLLIVGGADTEVLELNRLAQRQLRCPSELAVVPNATHLFEEPGALDQVTHLAVRWLDTQLAARPVSPARSTTG